MKSFAPEAVANYVRDVMTRETPLQKRLRAETAPMPRSQMQISPDQGALLALLAKLVDARRALEIGTFTGYSALAVASALPEDGLLIACDVNDEWTRVARRYWEEAELSKRIDLRLGPATVTLEGLIRDGAAGTFDFAFIDADKENHDAYYEACLTLVRPGGLIAIDNALWHGDVVNPAIQDSETRAIRALNEKIHADPRVDTALVTIADGVLLARPRRAAAPL
jgi:predicted O-methyltransferase YrrM